MNSKQTHYFAGDGNFGGADKVVILETHHWTESDWLEIEESYDLDRINTALVIDTKYRG